MANRKLIVEIIGDKSSLDKAFRGASRDAQKFQGNISGFGRSIKSLAAAAGGALAAVGLTRFASDSIKSAAAFETSMQRIVGLAGGAQGSIAGLSDEVLALATQVGKGPQELADALYFVASAGIAASDQMAVVENSAKAAAAGLGETQTVADAVTSAMNAYGAEVVSAANATDVLVATVREGKGEASAFAPVIGTVASIASQLGVRFEEVGAALAAQTRLGIGAETAATNLQAVFSSLLKETPKTAKALASVGLSHAGLREELKNKGLIATLTTLKKAFGDNTAAMAQSFPNIRALRGLLALVGKNAEDVRGVFGRMKDSTGALNTAFGAISQTTQHHFEQLGAAFDVIKIQVGAALAPIAGVVAQGLTKAASAVSDFITKFRKLEGLHAKLDFVLDVGRSVVTQAQRVAGEIRDRVGAALEQINWQQVGQSISRGLSSALEAIAAFVRSVDWAQVGGAIVSGVIDFLKGVDWVALFKAVIHLWIAALKAQAKLLAGAAEELGRQIVEGVGAGLDKAKDFVIQKLLQFINKILGVTGFLGRFDPFKGVREKVQARLKEMEGDTKTSSGKIQRTLQGIKGHDVSIGVSEHGSSQVQSTINAIKGKDVFINIKTTVTGALKGVGALAVGAADSAATAGDDDLGKAATVRAKKQGGALVAAASAVVTTTTKTAAQIKAAAAAAKKIRTAFDKLIDSLNLKLDKAQLTTTSKDDIAVLGQMETAIKNQIKAEGATTELLRQLFTVRQQKVQVQKDQFAALIAALGLSLDKAQITATFKDDIAVLNKMEVAIRAEIKKEGETTDLLGQLFTVRQQQAEAQRNQRNAKQFQALGLTAAGEKIVPSATAILKRVGTVKNLVKGTLLDTPKTRTQLANIVKILSGAFGKVGKDVRQAALGMLNDITSALDDKSGGHGEFTRGGIRSTQKLLKGLGLTPEQAAELKRRNLGVSSGSHTSAFGFGIKQPSLAGAALNAGITNEIRVFVGGQEMTNVVVKETQKAGRRRAGSRRGRAGGRQSVL